MSNVKKLTEGGGGGGEGEGGNGENFPIVINRKEENKRKRGREFMSGVAQMQNSVMY